MKKLLLHSVFPGAGTGYGQQCAVWAPRLASLGYEVAISAFAAPPRHASATDWNGHTVYQGGGDLYGRDALPGNARHFGADLVITLCDPWALGPEAMSGLPVACWTPVDCEPLGRADHIALTRGGAKAIAMSRHGERMLADAGHRPCYVPHGVDSSVFRPPAEPPEDLRRQLGLGGRFVIGIVATNKDDRRKGWWEQLSAFARLHARHPDTALIAHTIPAQKGGLDLRSVAADLGIARAVLWGDGLRGSLGEVSQEQLARTYGAMHLFSLCSLGEGFGLPLAEAQLCGVPAVATNASAMAEVCGGWLAGGQEQYHIAHKARWKVPSIPEIARVYEKAYQRGAAWQAKKTAARDHAMQYDADTVLNRHWKPALDALLA
jgi:glycosyltransferase involved in cell wall biosynthesis